MENNDNDGFSNSGQAFESDIDQITDIEDDEEDE